MKKIRTHTAQIEIGLRMLRKQHKLDFKIKSIPYNPDEFPTPHLVMVQFNGVKFAFDMLDGYNLNLKELEKFLSNVDVYYKRSCNTEINKSIKGGEKIKPLGLNYGIFYPSIQNRIKRIILNLCHWVGIQRGDVSFPNDICAKPSYKDIKILYITRLWNPRTSKDVKQSDERIHMNIERVDLCRQIRKKYPNSISGLMDSAYAREIAPELILPRYVTVRDNYLKEMKRSDICIATTGLHKSIGWRFGEYVAASKAILSEKLEYEVPYDFKSGKNYLEFDTSSSCMQHIDKLMENPSLINAMKQENHDYYNNYLRPDKLVASALSQYIELNQLSYDPDYWGDWSKLK